MALLNLRIIVSVCLVMVLVVSPSCSRRPVSERAQEEYDAGHYREALFLIKHHFRKGGERSPELLFLAGKSWLRLGIEAEAEDAFAEVYSADSTWAPEIASELKEEALRSIDRGLSARGRRFLQQAINYDSGLDFGRYNAIAGELLFEQKDYDGAILHFERYLEEHPDTGGAAEVMMNLASAYEEKGDVEKAVELYNRFQEIYTKSRLKTTARWKLENLLYETACDLRSGGDVGGAVGMLTELASSAQNPLVRERANFLLGEIHEEGGDIDKAISYYTKVVDLNLGSSSRLVEKAKERIEKLEISKPRK